MSAYTVATIDGDSTGLVNALGSGGKAMVGVQADARKLSDQLRDVKDSADKAAGSFVQRLGGSTAINALAGIGITVGGIGAAFSAVQASMGSFYASQGAEGAAALTALTREVDSLKGALFGAVMGTDSAKEATARLVPIIKGMGEVIGLALTPLRAITDLLWGTPPAADAAADAYDRFAESHRLADAELMKEPGMVQAMSNLSTLQNKIDTVLGRKEKLRQQGFLDLIAEIDVQQKAIAVAAKTEAMKRVTEENNRFEAARSNQIRRDLAAMFRSDEEHAEREYLLRMQAARDKFFEVALAREKGNTDFLTAEQQNVLQGLEDDRQLIVEKSQEKIEEIRNRPPSGGRRPAKVETEELGPLFRTPDPKELVNVIEEADGVLRILTQSQVQAYMLDEDEYGAHRSRMLEISYEELSKMDEYRQANQDAETRILTEGTIAREAIEKAAREKKEEEDNKAKDAKIAADKAVFAEYVAQNAKQVAIGLASGKKLADIARAQLGNVVNGLGDKAMIEAGVMYAAGDIPGAALMTAAGMAAYAAGTALGATAKKQTAATPAAAATAAPQNIAYNLRVDAAFADGELVARQFSRMQREAGRRGFATAGAY